MDRRSFFGLLPAATLAPVAAVAAATNEPGVFLPDNVPVVSQDEFSRLRAEAYRDFPNSTKSHRFLDEVVGADNWTRRYGVVDMLSVNGRVVAMRRTPTRRTLEERELRRLLDDIERGNVTLRHAVTSLRA